ncbi:MAG TPA: NB-ARC domain-containing protein, partial [Streptosporangiaceae bacterium]
MHAAHLLSPQYPDGQLFADLRGADEHPVPAGQVVARFARALGLPYDDPPPDADELTASYRSRLAGRRCLLLLDNAVDEDQVRPLIPAGSACLVLITSRNRLAGLAGDGARFVALDPLTEQNASRLLASTAPAGIDWSEPSARELISICGRLPLALRITGAQLATGSTASAGELGIRLLTLETRLARLEIGNLAVRASFALSYLKLPPPAKTVFRRLGLFTGPTLTAPMTAQLAGLDVEQAADALHLLQQRSLLRLAGTGRYELHDLLRLYADECSLSADTAQERADARRRLADWMLHRLVGAATAISPSSWHVEPPSPDSGDAGAPFDSCEAALAWLDAEHANLYAAVSWLADAALPRHAWQLAVELWHWFNLRGHHAEWIRTGITGQACAQRLGDADAEALVLQSLAAGYFRSRRFTDALRAQQQALALFRHMGD